MSLSVIWKGYSSIIRGRSPNSTASASRGVRAPSPNSVDDVVDRRLLHFPFAGIPVVAGQGEAMPILIIQLHVIAPVVIPRPPRFLAEQRVMGHGLRGQKPVVQLPRALERVKVFGAHVAHVFLQHGEQLEAALEQHAVRHVVGADAADVFVHDLLEALKTVDREEVARRYGPGDDLVARSEEHTSELQSLTNL